jgi:flavin-dependent dehydrogenase
MFDYDVIVVGCGPSGLMAAGELQRRGIDVAAIDVKVHLDKVYRAAAGFFLAEQDFNGDYIKNEPKGDKTLLTWERCGFSYLYPGKTLAIYKTHLVSNGGVIYTLTGLKKPFLHNFDPTTWVKGLYDEAEKAGVSFHPKTMLLHAREIPGGMEIDIRRDGRRSGTMTCRKLVACDGLSSRTAKSLGMNRDRPLMGRGPTVEYYMENVEAPFEEGDYGIFGWDNLGVPHGYVVMVPGLKGTRDYRVETIIPGDPAIINYNSMKFLLEKSHVAHWFKNAKILSKHTAVMEMYPAMKRPGQGGFEEYSDWWNHRALEMTNDLQKMAEYVKRFYFDQFVGADGVDRLFEIAKDHPFIVDEFNGNPYGFARTIIDHLLTLPGIKPEWREGLERMKVAGLQEVMALGLQSATR